MRRTSGLALLLLAFTLVPMCMGTSCQTDMRDAVYAGVLDYVSGTTADSVNSLMPLSQAMANLFAGPTGAQDR